MAAFWPEQPDSNPVAAHMNSTPKYVVSKSLTEAAWPGTLILGGEVIAEVIELKASARGDIAVLGSGMLGRELLANDLVDELRLFIHPLLLGTGKRLFGERPQPSNLILRSVDHTDLGTVAITYDVQHAHELDVIKPRDTSVSRVPRGQDSAPR